jgi:GNAT superfamily N-acetyltransferase
VFNRKYGKGNVMIAKDGFTAAEQSVSTRHSNVQSAQSRVMQADDVIQFRPLTLAHREILLRMYRNFDPLGLAHGLPPPCEESRQIWIDRALQQEINMGAFLPTGDLMGHSFLASSGAGEAEVAVFVQHGYHRRGIGTVLVKGVLQRAEQRGLRRILAMTARENVPALRLLKRCGFRFWRYILPSIELALELPPPMVLSRNACSGAPALTGGKKRI